MTYGTIYSVSGVVNDCRVNGAFAYVGKTERPFEERLHEHLRDLKNGKHKNPWIQGYVNDYGVQSIQYRILATLPVYLLDDVERFYVQRLNTLRDHNQYGWNRISGGMPVKYDLTPVLVSSGDIHYSAPSLYDWCRMYEKPGLSVILPYFKLDSFKDGYWAINLTDI